MMGKVVKDAVISSGFPPVGLLNQRKIPVEPEAVKVAGVPQLVETGEGTTGWGKGFTCT